MRARRLPLAAAIAVLLLLPGRAVFAARQLVALFPLQNLADNTIAPDVASLGQALKEKLQDRLDVQAMSADSAQDTTGMKKKARGVGATYILVVPNNDPNNPDHAGRDIRLTYEDGQSIIERVPEIAAFTPIFFASERYSSA